MVKYQGQEIPTDENNVGGLLVIFTISSAHLFIIKY